MTKKTKKPLRARRTPKVTRADNPTASKAGRRERNWPHWAYPSLRAFKAQKRLEARNVELVVKTLRYGCAYTPIAGAFDALAETVAEFRRLLSAKEWGR